MRARYEKSGRVRAREIMFGRATYRLPFAPPCLSWGVLWSVDLTPTAQDVYLLNLKILYNLITFHYSSSMSGMYGILVLCLTTMPPAWGVMFISKGGFCGFCFWAASDCKREKKCYPFL